MSLSCLHRLNCLFLLYLYLIFVQPSLLVNCTWNCVHVHLEQLKTGVKFLLCEHTFPIKLILISVTLEGAITSTCEVLTVEKKRSWREWTAANHKHFLLKLYFQQFDCLCKSPLLYSCMLRHPVLIYIVNYNLYSLSSNKNVPSLINLSTYWPLRQLEPQTNLFGRQFKCWGCVTGSGVH